MRNLPTQMKSHFHISLFVIGATFLTALIPSGRATDAATVQADQDSTVIGFDVGEWKGAELSTEQVKIGTHSALWKDHLANESISSGNIPHDWTGYDGLKLWIYNAGKPPVAFMIVAVSQKDRATFSYYAHRVVVDWEGWNEVRIPFTAFEPNRDPVGWNKIDSVLITSKGWALKPGADAFLYLDGLTLTKSAQ